MVRIRIRIRIRVMVRVMARVRVGVRIRDSVVHIKDIRTDKATNGTDEDDWTG
jgi:hypothetical protein